METTGRAHGSRVPAILALLGTVFFWGLSFVASKTILNAGVPPMTMVCIRFVVACVILFPLLRIREPSARLDRGSILAIVLSGFFGVTVYFFFESRGIKLTSASNASMIIATVPIFTLLAELIFFRGRISALKAVGIALSVAGVYLVIQKAGDAGDLSNRLVGDALMLGACLCWVIYNMLSRNLHARMSDLAITTYQNLAGTLFLIPLALSEHRQWVPLTPLVGLNLLYLAAFCSALGYFLYMYALSRLGPVTATPFVNLVPVVGVLGGIILLGETITLLQLLGGAIIVCGVVLVTRRS